jgi:apoptotic chromatin condensation inducer in the nucleus
LTQAVSEALKDVSQPALKRSFGRSDSTANGDSPKELIVPPSQKPATTSLRIDRFVRPFTLKAVQELLGKTGSVQSFWMDHIKTHCYVTVCSVCSSNTCAYLCCLFCHIAVQRKIELIRAYPNIHHA